MMRDGAVEASGGGAMWRGINAWSVEGVAWAEVAQVDVGRVGVLLVEEARCCRYCRVMRGVLVEATGQQEALVGLFAGLVEVAGVRLARARGEAGRWGGVEQGLAGFEELAGAGLVGVG